MVAEITGCSPDRVRDDATIWDLGLDSLKMMVVAAKAQGLGYVTDFAQLSQCETFGGWLRSLTVTEPAVEPPPTSTEDAHPDLVDMTAMQLAYWQGRNPDLPLGGVGAQYYVEFDRAADRSAEQYLERLTSALAALTRRHGLLRCHVVPPSSLRVQPYVGGPSVTVYDNQASDPAVLEEVLADRRDHFTSRTLDVVNGEVLLVAVSLLPDQRWRTHLVVDMLICDGEGFATLLGELSTALQQPDADLGVSPPSFAQAASWCQIPDGAADQDYWHDAIATMPLPPPTCTSPTGTMEVSASRLRRHVWLEPAQRTKLEQVAANTHTSLAAVLATAYSEVVARWSGIRQFALNVPTSLRSRAPHRCAGVIGDFTDFALVRIDLPRDTWAERCRSVHTSLLGVLSHSGMPGPEQLRALSRREGRPVTAPVVFTSVLSVGEFYRPSVRAALGEPIWTSSQVPQTTLDCQVLDDRGGIAVNWDVAAQVWPDGVVDAMFAAFLDLLRQVTGDADDPQVTLPAEQQHSRDAPATATPPTVRALHADLVAAARQHPDAVAIIGAADSLSYGELLQRAQATADLLRSRTEAGDRVAVCLPKGIEQIIGTVAVSMAGLTYVPIAPTQPPARRRHMVTAANITAALVTDPGSGKPSSDSDSDWPATVTLLSVAAVGSPHPAVADDNVADVDPAGLAYIIFTSGSTGAPKGVMMSHQAAMNTLDDVRRRFGLDQRDRVLGVSQLDFDLSVYDIFATLGAGAALVLPSDDSSVEPGQLRQFATAQAVTVWNSVPALFDMLLTAAAGELWPELRLVLLSGDWIGTDLPQRVTGNTIKVIAMGGATEAGIWSNYTDITDADLTGWMSAPYGYPLSRQAFRVVNPDGEDCPDWVVGELYIGGASLANGYLNDSALTKERFVSDGTTRWYRTGDYGRYRPGAILEFLGRRDQQVKIGGFRIELGEIEAACRRCVGVDQAVVVAAGPRKQTLVAFVTTSAYSVDVLQVEDSVREQLPAYMVPRRILHIDTMPLTANEKIDRAALVRAALQADNSTATPTSEMPIWPTLHQVWRSLTDAPLRPEDNFFRAGGDSLLAVRMLAALAGHGIQGGTLRRLIEADTVGDFCQVLSLSANAQRGERGMPHPAQSPRPAETVPYTAVQRAYLMGERTDQPLGGIRAMSYWEFEAAESVDPDRLRVAVDIVANRYPILGGEAASDGMILRCLPSPPIAVLSPTEFIAWQQQVGEAHGDAPRHPLQIAICPASANASGGAADTVGIWLDHLYLDASSAMVVFNDLGDAYRTPGSVSAEPFSLVGDHATDRPTVFVRAADRTYWQQQLTDLPDAPQLPTLSPAASVAAPVFDRQTTLLDSPTWAGLRRAAQRHETPVSVLILAAFTRIVAAASRSRDITVVVTTFDRHHHQMVGEGAVGDYTDLLLLPYRGSARPAETFDQTLATVWRTLADVVDHRSLSGLAIMAELGLHGRPLGPAVVFTSAIGLPRRDDPLEQPFGSYRRGRSQTPQTLLDCQVLEHDGGLVVNLDYVADLLPGPYVADLLAALTADLDNLASHQSPGYPIPVPPGTGTRFHPAPQTTPAAAGPPTETLADPDPVTLTSVCEVWSRMLGISVDADADFFDLGGDSLVATATAAAIRDRIGVDLSLREVLAARTARRIAVVVAARQEADQMVSGTL